MTLQLLRLSVRHVAPIHMPPLKQIRHKHYIHTQQIFLQHIHCTHSLQVPTFITFLITGLGDSVVSCFLLSWGLEVVFTVAPAAPATLHYSHLSYLCRKVQVPPGHPDSSEFLTKSTIPHALHNRCSTLCIVCSCSSLEILLTSCLTTGKEIRVYFFVYFFCVAHWSQWKPSGWMVL